MSAWARSLAFPPVVSEFHDEVGAHMCLRRQKYIDNIGEVNSYGTRPRFSRLIGKTDKDIRGCHLTVVIEMWSSSAWMLLSSADHLAPGLLPGTGATRTSRLSSGWLPKQARQIQKGRNSE